MESTANEAAYPLLLSRRSEELEVTLDKLEEGGLYEEPSPGTSYCLTAARLQEHCRRWVGSLKNLHLSGNQYRSLYERRTNRLQYLLCSAATVLLLLVVGIVAVLHRGSGHSIAEDWTHGNPYFATGNIAEHNAAVSARLDRCRELGLLRDTKNLLPPLSAVDEARAQAEGCGTNQTTVVILASRYFAEVFSGGFYSTTGESIWAESVISSLNKMNYSYMFTSREFWVPDLEQTMEYYHSFSGQVRMVLADKEQTELCWRDHGQNCLKREGNEDGIPAWRLLSFYYWEEPVNPLGAGFTLAPAPSGNNHFLSYSIEPTCRSLPFLPARQRVPYQAYLLAKQAHYFETGSEFAWTLDGLHDIQEALDISMVAGMRNDSAEVLQAVLDAGISDLGYLRKIDFYQELAKSSVLIGVGNPKISPSPWDALCMGVPVSLLVHTAQAARRAYGQFINPVLAWDEADPDNREKWQVQQWRMLDMHPPYVYHVKAGDLTGLRDAIQMAIENPIKRYIPDYMRFDFATGKVAEILEMDWKAKAAVILDERIRTGQGECFAADYLGGSESTLDMDGLLVASPLNPRGNLLHVQGPSPPLKLPLLAPLARKDDATVGCSTKD